MIRKESEKKTPYGAFFVYLTASLNALPALNAGAFVAAISSFSPVCGLRDRKSVV